MSSKLIAQDSPFYTKSTLVIKGQLHTIGEPWVMGIINVTNDSFYSGSRKQSEKLILAAVENMLHKGAKIIDVGAYSTRPGAIDVPVEEEIDRMAKAIPAIRKEWPEALISVDTFRKEVAHFCLDQGADIINDVSGIDLRKGMADLVKNYGVPYIAMHMRGDPQTMVGLNKYKDLLTDVAKELGEKVAYLKDFGVKDIIVDPGFGFAKSIEQNFELLKNLSYFKILECPILVGISRKSMIYKTLDIDPSEALNGTTVLNTIAALNGASILRVHDVEEAVQLSRLINAMRN